MQAAPTSIQAMDGRIEVSSGAGARPARSAGQSSQPDVGEAVMPAPMALVTFPERKVTRAVGRRGKRHGCRVSRGKAAHSVRDTLIRPSGTFSRKREKGVQ